MLIEAQLDLLKNDDWDHLLEYEVDAVLRKKNNFLIFLTFSGPFEYNTFINSDEKTIERDRHDSKQAIKRPGKVKARDGRNHADQPFSFLSEPRVG